MYVFRKIIEYFFPIIDETLLYEAMEKLDEKEKEIFNNMMKYDKFHSLQVYKKLKQTSIAKKNIYLKLALLHDCGKGKAGILKRVLHKIGIRTNLKKHSELGKEKVFGINEELALLIENHHIKNYSSEMNIFQKCDDES